MTVIPNIGVIELAVLSGAGMIIRVAFFFFVTNI
jgi:hypothetical protein